MSISDSSILDHIGFPVGAQHQRTPSFTGLKTHADCATKHGRTAETAICPKHVIIHQYCVPQNPETSPRKGRNAWIVAAPRGDLEMDEPSWKLKQLSSFLITHSTVRGAVF